ncbi:hypothetical protein PYCC9005_000478 [Savitreella phatthalungensis]
MQINGTRTPHVNGVAAAAATAAPPLPQQTSQPARPKHDDIASFIFNAGFINASFADTHLTLRTTSAQSPPQSETQGDTMQRAKFPSYSLHALFAARSPIMYDHLTRQQQQQGGPPYAVELDAFDSEITVDGLNVALGSLYTGRSVVPDVALARGVLAASILFGLDVLRDAAWQMCTDSWTSSDEGLREGLAFCLAHTGNHANASHAESSQVPPVTSSSGLPGTGTHAGSASNGILFGGHAQQQPQPHPHSSPDAHHPAFSHLHKQPPGLESSSSRTVSPAPPLSAGLGAPLSSTSTFSPPPHGVTYANLASALLPKLVEKLTRALPAADKEDLLVGLPFQLVKQVLESTELAKRLPSMMERNDFARRILAARKPSLVQGVEETVVMAFTGSSGLEIIRRERGSRKKTLWKATAGRS